MTEPTHELPSLDARLVCWLAVQTLEDRAARLVDGGEDSDTRIALADLFTDLPVVAHEPRQDGLRLRRWRAPRRAQEDTPPIMQLLLAPREGTSEACGARGRWLLVSGPGSGKTTITRMVAQQLRQAWIAPRRDELPLTLRDEWAQANARLNTLATQEGWVDIRRALPLRITLPYLARWMAGHAEPSTLSLWDYLAHRVVEDLDHWELNVELDSRRLRDLVEAAGSVMWILDGLDEVPETAGRESMLELVRATVCDPAREADGLLVSTRPQGYKGEFDELDELELTPLPEALAANYAERVLRATYAHQPEELSHRIEQMRAEFSKDDVAELLYTPLHTTMAALLIANRGALPKARSRLFEHYFDMILRRELGKPTMHGIKDEDRGIIRTLHQRAGLLLQVRSQAQSGARAILHKRELRAILAAIFTGLDYDEDTARLEVDRFMRFAAERLVLLLHAAQGEYEFGIRSLQEFFAAKALFAGDPDTIRERLGAIALHSHWSNVMAFIASEAALATEPAERTRVLTAMVDLCRALNAGTVGGEAAQRCVMGSRLAMHILSETEGYGHPWFHKPLWEIALEAATSPVQKSIASTEQRRSRRGWTDHQEIHTRLGVLAGAWATSMGDQRRGEVLALAAEALELGREHADRGWRLLHGLLIVEMPEAIALADQYAPRTRRSARELVTILTLDEHHPTPRWIGQYADRHPEWLLAFNPIAWSLESPAALNSPDSLVFGLSEVAISSTRIALGSIVFASIKPSIPDLLEEFRACIPDKPKWTFWVRLVNFLPCPCPSSLADILDTIDSEETFDDLLEFSPYLPWPLQSCLRAAESQPDLASMAVALRAGKLGTAEDWRAAEDRWRAQGEIRIEDIQILLDCEGPWNHDIASRGVPLVSGLGSILLKDIDAVLPGPDLDRPPAKKLHSLLSENTYFGFPIPLRIVRELGRGANGLRRLPSVDSLAVGLQSAHAEQWLAMLDKWGKNGVVEGDTVVSHVFLFRALRLSISRVLSEHLHSRHDLWGLVEILSATIPANADFDIPTIPNDAPPHILAARAYLRLVVGDFDSEELPSLLDTIGDRLSRLAQFLEHRSRTPDKTQAILLTALDRAELTAEQRDALLGALHALLQHTTGLAFASPDAWTRFALPPPDLGLAPPPPTPPRLLSIDALTNARIFKTTPIVDTPFPTPSAERGQWIVLVGENGVGKTTLLRALALALAPAPVASKLLDERLPFVRNGAEARISLRLNVGRLDVVVARHGRTEQVESRSPETARPWVVGYGVRRGNARGEQDRDAEPGALGELHTLFDRPASLHNASQWLADLEADVLREKRDRQGADAPAGPREQVWRSVQRALRDLLGVKKVEVVEGGLVMVEHEQFGRVRLDALSDGYLTTAGWVIDMIARWVDRQYELDEPIGPDVLRQMCGFVLIDEIDLHLHPTWQLRILDDIRRLFPRLSFVVTTHNPLTLQGARPGEVYIMRRHGSGVELVQHDIRPGHDVDRVLFDQFGLTHTFDRKTRDLLARHRELVERGTPVEDPERAKVEVQLRERFGGLAQTLGSERELSHGPMAPLTPEERESFMAEYGKKA